MLMLMMFAFFVLAGIGAWILDRYAQPRAIRTLALALGVALLMVGITGCDSSRSRNSDYHPGGHHGDDHHRRHPPNYEQHPGHYYYDDSWSPAPPRHRSPYYHEGRWVQVDPRD